MKEYTLNEKALIVLDFYEGLEYKHKVKAIEIIKGTDGS